MPVAQNVAFALGFKAIFLVTTLLGLAGLISSKVMAAGRRYAIVAVVVVAAVVTPPDVLSQIMLAVPMILLYEMGILVCRIVKPRAVDGADGDSEESKS